MTTILLDPDNYDENLEDIIKTHRKIKIIETKYSGIDESFPVVFRYPEGVFYGHVFSDRINDVIGGNADDLIIQTARTFTVEMKKYVSEEKYRLMVIGFFEYLDQIKPFVSDVISKGINTFSIKHKYLEKELIEVLQMALIKTTKGPLIADLIEAFGKAETEKRLKKYLKLYKYRF